MNKQIIYKKLLTEKFIPPTRINFDETMLWLNKYGDVHSVNGQPAIIWSNGDKAWYKNNEQHRDGDKPAVVWSEGDKIWYKNGQLHRDGDKPAIIWSNGIKVWYKNGKFIKNNC